MNDLDVGVVKPEQAITASEQNVGLSNYPHYYGNYTSSYTGSSTYRPGYSTGQTYSAINPNKKVSASQTYARLLRDQWADYVERFQPYDEKLREIATGDADNKQAEQIARNAVDSGFRLAEGSFSRDMSRQGISLSPEEKMVTDRQNQIDKTAAEVGSVNAARLHARDRDQALMAGDLAVGLREANNQ